MYEFYYNTSQPYSGQRILVYGYCFFLIFSRIPKTKSAVSDLEDSEQKHNFDDFHKLVKHPEYKF